MSETETSPELMRALGILSSLPPPPQPPPGSTWTRFAAALPPDDGTPVEARFDDEPDVRYFVSWRGPDAAFVHARRYIAFSPASTPDVERTPEGGEWGFYFTNRFPPRIEPTLRGWWRLLPADDPPPVPADAA